MKQIALVTGGAGFIGSHTADALAKRGFRVRIVDHLAPPVHNGRWPAYVQGKGYELVRGDVRKKSIWAKALRGVHVVYHLAAYQDQRLDFSTFFETNTVSTALLYEVAVEKKIPLRSVVVASSQFVYGDGFYRCAHQDALFAPDLRTRVQFLKKEWDIHCPHGKSAHAMPFREDQKVNPTNAYGLSKYALENTALRLGKTYEIPTVVLRYSIVQGARQSPKNIYSGALRIFVQQALAGLPITVYENGEQTRDFVNISDVVQANLMPLVHKKMHFEIYNVGGGRAYRVIDFARAVQRITNTGSKIIIGGFRRTDTRHAVSDIGKIKRLGWVPRYGIEDSITAYVQWMKKEGYQYGRTRRALASLAKGIVH